MTAPSRYRFDPERYERELTAIIGELLAAPVLDAEVIARVVKRYPKDGHDTFSKSEIVRGFRRLEARHGWATRDPRFVEKLRTKPVRTESGVAPVTVLTKPYPCPGECVFCPNDVRMPKSYLSMEPGAQRATHHAFDPYEQTFARLLAFHANGHRVDKVELIVLGGTWSFYPERYQRWFVKRCFDALNDFGASDGERPPRERPVEPGHRSFLGLEERVSGGTLERSYNEVVSGWLRVHQDGQLLEDRERASWEELEAAHRANEAAACRAVGLSLETRPDLVNEAETLRLRRLGATKVQLGLQTLSDDLLAANKRGHDAGATRRALRLLRAAGFKLQVHWMPNLLGATPESDLADFARLFDDPEVRPDELKLYPTSLVETAELVQHHAAGAWRPYGDEVLLDLLASCLARVPRWCRVTRVIRDIPSHDILVGNKLTNLRQLATARAEARGLPLVDIRAREIRGEPVDAARLSLVETRYATALGEEVFLELVTAADRLVGFLRLALPAVRSHVAELEAPAGLTEPVAPRRGAGPGRPRSAVVREVHVYGAVAALGQRDGHRAQHLGLGRRLVERAAELARAAGHRSLAVISAVGTRAYYRDLGFVDGALYQHRSLDASLSQGT